VQYSLIIIWQGKSARSDWFFPDRDFAIRTVSVETVISCVFFLFSKAGKFKTNMIGAPYNKLLTNLASSSRTGEYWPSVVFVWTSLRSVRTATTSGQYFPVRPSRSVSKRLVSDRALSRLIPHLCLCSLCFLQSCNKSLINQACSGPYWENIGPRSFLYGPRCAGSVLSRPRADILPVRPSRMVNKIYVFTYLLLRSERSERAAT